MPIEFHCDHERRIVFARAKGILTDEEVFGYQRTVWSREDNIGYDEVIEYDRGRNYRFGFRRTLEGLGVAVCIYGFPVQSNEVCYCRTWRPCVWDGADA